MKIVGLITVCFFWLISSPVFSQRGKIIKAGDVVMDPNQDGFVSRDNTGFSSRAYNVPEFEFKMFGIPKAGGDVTGDNIGKSCGITDLIPDSLGYAAYAAHDVNNNLIFRFRVGANNSSVEAWTVLLDTDGLYGIGIDPNATTNNPGFELDITLIKNPNDGVWVYNIDGIESCPKPLISYPISSHFQIAIADEGTCGNADYFYDFYVPFAEIAAVFNAATGSNMDINTGLRYAALTNVSATCAMGGKISDVSGVNDTDYNGCYSCMFADLISAQCSTPVVNLCQTCSGFATELVHAPTIDQPLRAGQASVSGRTIESNIFIDVKIFSNIAPAGSPPAWGPVPREEHGVYSVGTIWQLPLNSPLQAFDKVVARAQLTANSVPCGVGGNNQTSTSVTVVQPNTSPSAQNQTISVVEDTPKNIVLTGSDPEGDPLTFLIVSFPSSGFLSGTIPNLTYTPNLNYNGPDALTFRVSDGIYVSNAATVTLNVTPVNDAPIANNLSVTTNEDIAVATTLTASDVDVGDVLTYVLVSGPVHGALSGTIPTLTYLPGANYFGQDSYTFKVNDGHTDSNVATVSINIISVNDPPVANAQSVTTTEDTQVAITLTGSDPDGDAMVFSLVSGPSHGTLTGTAPNVTYKPSANYNGADAFSFKITDPSGAVSNTATVTLNVTPVNDAPIANNLSVTTNEDIAVATTLTASDVDVGDVLTYVLVSGPVHGALSGTIPTLTYLPGANYFGQDSYTFKVNDGHTDSNVATVSINIISVNDPPVANAQSVTTTEDTQVAITLTGSDPDGDAMVFSLVSGPSHGTLTGTAPNVTYKPSANYNGADAFSFKITDPSGAVSNTATVTLNVTPVNDAPIANNLSVTTNEDIAVATTLTASDVDVGDVLTYVLVSGPVHGALSGTIPTLTYLPGANYFGQDSYTFKVNDGHTDSNVATVSINIISVNDPPVANAQSVTTTEDTQVAITLTGSDPDGDAMVFSLVSGPSHGTLTGTAPNVTYKPSANYNGADAFSFKITDPSGAVSNTATVTLNVTPVNDAPIANNLSVTTNEDIAVATTLTASDVDVGDVLTYVLVSGPVHGALSGTIPTLTYLPGANYFGQDSYTFKVNDGHTDSNVATVSINIISVNDPPVANAQSVTTTEDTQVAITLTGSDPDGDAMVFSLVSGPSHGTLTGTAPNVTYKPSANYNGADAFSFKITDPSGAVSNTATVTLNVTPVNDAPVAISKIVNYIQDTPKSIILDAFDADLDPLLFTVLTFPTNGSLSGTAPNIIYTPNSGYVGPDDFTFKANDGQVDSNVGTISLSLTLGSNVAPISSDQSISTLEDTPSASFNLISSDANGDNLTYIITLPPSHGILTLDISTGIASYLPNPNYNGSDSFKFKSNDGVFDSNEATVFITVTPVNDKPVADAQSLTTNEDTSLGITLTGSDVENSTLTYLVVSGPSNGTLSGAGAGRTYMPSLDFNGADSFTFIVNDGSLNSEAVTVSITINPVNDAPVANSMPIATLEDTGITFSLSGTDVDGNSLVYTITQQPTNGTLTIPVGASVTYLPSANYNGSDSFKFKVNDGITDSNEATISITVTPVNDPPVANAESLTTNEDTPLSISLTGSDVESSTLSYSIVSGPSNGTLSGTGAGRTYIPSQDFNGADSFSFTVNDGSVDSSPAIVTIIVTPVNDSPVANNQSITIAENVVAPITLTGSDVDGNALTYTIMVQPSHGLLSGTLPNIAYTPSTNYSGPDSFTFTVNDGTVDSNIATVSIAVLPVNHPPIANDQSVTLFENTPASITLSGNDEDGNALNYTIITTPLQGTLTGIPPNLTYAPTLNYSGSDSFTFLVNDGTVDSNTATVSIIVTFVNHAPVADSQTSGVTLPENSTTPITLTGSDVDGNALTYILLTQPVHGVLSGIAPNLIYIPDLNYNGSDSFTFKVNDGTVDSNLATVSIVVTPVNQPPIVNDQSVTLQEDVPTTIALSGSDEDGNALSYSVVTQPSHGTLSGIAPNLTYTPASNFFGADSFTFDANDGTVDSNIATVFITVTPVNHPPKADDQSISLLEDAVTSIVLAGSDADGNAITFILVTQPAHGTLSGTAPSVTYTPTLNFNGSDSFTFMTNDGAVDSNIATVTITVLPISHPPVANDQSVAIQEDVATIISLSGDDSDGHALTYIPVTQPVHGILTGTGQNLNYTPFLNYNGPDNFTFKVNNGIVDSNVATVSITVIPVNDAPMITFIPDLYTTEDSIRQVCLNVVDVDGDNITYGQPANSKGGGTMVRDNPPFDFCYIFSPPLNYNGESLWDMSVCDSGNLCGTTLVKIIISPVNDPPVAVNDEISVNSRQATSFNAIGNDYVIAPPYKEFYDIYSNDPAYKDELVMSTTPVTGPYNGSCDMSANGTISYTPKFDFVGSDSIKYRVCDSGNLCATAVVFIDVGFPPFKIYEGVSPNGDDKNDYWRIDGIELFPKNLVRVFDRFDNVVFETSGYSNESNNWRGQANHGLVQGTLPEGTYFYTVNLGNGEHALSGYVVLKRH